MPIIIRRATAEDEHAIKAIVRAARLNPMRLDWPRFVVAAWGEDVIGVGQVKPHGDGTRELASLAVVPEWQGQHLGSLIVRALLAREAGTLHLLCLPEMAGYYARFGFRRLGRAELTPYFRRIDSAARVMRLLAGDRLHLPVVMRRSSS
jgi:N-acetylglutamate synthase-like GNAT family acetyltransferase